MTIRYLDFDVSVELDEAGRCVSKVVASPAGEAEAVTDWPFSEQDIELLILRATRSQRTRRGSSPRPDADHAREFGRALADTVFGNEVGTCLLRSLDQAERDGKGLRLRFHLGDAHQLGDVPWEYLYSASLRRFLALSTATPLVRYLDLPRRIEPVDVEGPLEILVVVANPIGTTELDVEHEWELIRLAVADLTTTGRLRLTRLEPPTLAALQHHLRRHQVHVLHFLGHGGFDESRQEGLLYFEDDDRYIHEVTTESLGTIVHDHTPLQIAVLNSCEGGRSSASDPFTGLASGLVAQGFAAVVAMQFEITDRAATRFAHALYESIADQYPIDAAVSEARKSLFTAGLGMEWATPVLYMRAPDGRIFTQATTDPAADGHTADLGPVDRPEPRSATTVEPSDDDESSGLPDNPLVSRRLVIAAGGSAVIAALAGVSWLALRPAAGWPLTLRWSFQTDGEVFSSPAVADGLVYVGSNDGHLYAIDARTGTERWRYRTGEPVTSSPTVVSGLVHVGANDANLHAVNAASGNPAWRFETGGVIHSSPTVAGDTVYVGSRDHFLYAVDRSLGELRWRFEGGDWFNSSPRVAEGVVVIGCRDHDIYGVDAATGERLWAVTTGSTVDSSAEIDGDTSYIGSDDHQLYAIRLDGSQSWRFQAEAGVVSTPVKVGSVLYVGSDDGSLYALDASTGRARWRFETGNGIRSTPLHVDGAVYVGSRDRYVYMVDASTGAEIGRFETDGPIDDSSPAFADGLVYIGSLDGRLYCLERRRR